MQYNCACSVALPLHLIICPAIILAYIYGYNNYNIVHFVFTDLYTLGKESCYGFEDNCYLGTIGDPGQENGNEA